MESNLYLENLNSYEILRYLYLLQIKMPTLGRSFALAFKSIVFVGQCKALRSPNSSRNLYTNDKILKYGIFRNLFQLHHVHGGKLRSDDHHGLELSSQAQRDS